MSVYARITDPSYSHSRRAIPRGTIVQLTAAQLEAATSRSDPPPMEKVSAPKEGVPVVDIRPAAARTALSEQAKPPAGEKARK